MIEYWLSIFAPSVLFRSPITPFVFFVPLPLKIAPKGAIPPTLRTTHLNQTEDIFRLLSTHSDFHKTDLSLICQT